MKEDLLAELDKKLEEINDHTVMGYAKRHGLNPETVRRMIREGRLVAVYRQGKQFIIEHKEPGA